MLPVGPGGRKEPVVGVETCVVLARRATKVDPLEALRSDGSVKIARVFGGCIENLAIVRASLYLRFSMPGQLAHEQAALRTRNFCASGRVERLPDQN